MAGLIKKQILKHLSRFAKNLSPDKINLSTLKGEGQLTNLELDEEVLQSLLDLPTWLAINRVECNKAAIRIPWTKLKTHPISLVSFNHYTFKSGHENFSSFYTYGHLSHQIIQN
ncbi:hypothetical protein PBY51_008599 [Eleginops maclovinus]|uniref:Chorein N-terminal domain-containing protein n=1 Tax=Eleginops maclovinus TaxID=56733 RepID=A0AAN7WSE3_ELEMC|nr:hypothetical protein PBY51_008599 [Eleginops maclovinus]